MNPSHDERGDAEDFQDAAPGISFVQKKSVKKSSGKNKSRVLTQTSDEPAPMPEDAAQEAAMNEEAEVQ